MVIYLQINDDDDDNEGRLIINRSYLPKFSLFT